jgi:hypothetical protein
MHSAACTHASVLSRSLLAASGAREKNLFINTPLLLRMKWHASVMLKSFSASLYRYPAASARGTFAEFAPANDISPSTALNL